MAEHGAVRRVAILRGGKGAKPDARRLVDEEEVSEAVPRQRIVFQDPFTRGVVGIGERADPENEIRTRAPQLRPAKQEPQVRDAR